MKLYRILSVGIHAITADEWTTLVRQWLTSNERHHVVTVNPEFVMEATKNVVFKRIINSASCALADGFGLLCASWLMFGRQVFTRITGVQASLILAGECASLQKSIYLVGGGEGVAEKTALALTRLFPGLKIAGAEMGLPFDCQEGDSAGLASRIGDTKPDVLLVAFGAPKQEMWIADHLAGFPSIKIAMGVGGTFDYLSGTVAYAPLWIRKAGLEWAYRLLQEPRRLNRILTATIRFPLAILKERVMPQGQL